MMQILLTSQESDFVCCTLNTKHIWYDMWYVFWIAVNAFESMPTRIHPHIIYKKSCQDGPWIASLRGQSGCHFTCVFDISASPSFASQIWRARASLPLYFSAICERVNQRRDPNLELEWREVTFWNNSLRFQSPWHVLHSSRRIWSLSWPHSPVGTKQFFFQNSHDEKVGVCKWLPLRFTIFSYFV